MKVPDKRKRIKVMVGAVPEVYKVRIVLNAEYTRFTNRLTLSLASVTIRNHLRFRGVFVRCTALSGSITA